MSRSFRGGSAVAIIPQQRNGPKRPYLSLHVPTLDPLDSPSDNKPMTPPCSPPPAFKELQSRQPNRLNSTIGRPAILQSLPPPPINHNVQITKELMRPVSIAIARQVNSQGTAYAPVIDVELPGIIRVTSSYDTIPNGYHFEKLPPLPPVEDPNFEPLFHKKLELCSIILDFTNPTNQVAEKEMKARSLCDFIELFEDSREIRKVDANHQNLVFEMLYENIFKRDPIFPKQALFEKTLQVDYSISLVEPSWPHLFYCYQILNRFIQVFPKSACFNMNTAKHAIHLTQLPDTNERMQLVAFLRTYFDYHPEDREKLLDCVYLKLLDLNDDIASPFCAMPLIILLTHMFTRTQGPISMQFTNCIRKAVLPLIGLPFFPLYHQNLRQLLSTVLASNPFLTLETLRDIEKQWPQTNGLKQQECIEMILFICGKMKPEDFEQIAFKIFAFLSECVASAHAKVSEIALDIWNKPAPNSWVVVNSRLAIRTMFENVSNVSEKHWNKLNVEKASQALATMCKVNKHTYHKMKMLQKQMRAQRYKPHQPNDCQRSWSTIAKTANEFDPSIDVKENQRIFYNMFHNEKRETLATTKFVPTAKDLREKAEKEARKKENDK